MPSIIDLYNSGGVDESLLTATGSGGLLSDGYLADEPLATHLDDGEPAVFVRSNAKSGVRREPLDGDGGEEVTPGDGYRAFALVTDSRLAFVVGAGDGGDDWTATVSLADVELVERESGVLSGVLAVTTSTDVRWTFPSRGDLAPVADYLETASMAWMGLEPSLAEARERVVDATQSLEDRAYDEAMGAVTDAAAATDDARDHEADLCPDGVPAMDERIASVEERVAGVRLRVLRGRAAHHIDVAESHWRDEEYEAAYGAYVAAKDDYAEALSVEAPEFAESWSLREKLARVERNLESLEGAPVRRADEFRELAADADDIDARAAHLSDALERYRTALELDWGRDERRFRGDTDEIRRRVDEVASALVDARRARAGQLVATANEHYEDGDYDRAARDYRAACEELKRGLDPARELVPDAADDMAEHVEVIRARLEELADRLESEGDEPAAERNRPDEEATESDGEDRSDGGAAPGNEEPDLDDEPTADVPEPDAEAVEPETPFEFGRSPDDPPARSLGGQND